MKKKGKNPVLTSPWKIGVLVVLLLLVTNAGVSYYLINQYHIDLKWLNSSGRVWGVDSSLFFKEAFPLVVAIIICSMFSYFIFASAVRRYKYYVDSGQDYRKMISLADSIDDLTNPAQIARLSNYPELQTILRNYGDEIKEISSEIDMKEKQFDSTELEMKIDSLLDGQPVEQSEGEDKWWTGIIRKLDKALQEKDDIVEKSKRTVEEERKMNGELTLSFGKIIEYTNEAIGNLSNITSSISDARELLGNTEMESNEDMKKDNSALESSLSNMNNSLKKLEEGGMAMRNFSESNNGLALNIALLAARGNIKESDLAGFAEKARETAEQFNKLGNAVITLSRNLTGDYHVFKSWIVNGDTQKNSGRSDVGKALSQITSRVDESREKLGINLNNLKDDIDRIDLILKKSVKGNSDSALFMEEESSTLYENEGIEEEAGQTEDNTTSSCEDEFVVSHGSAWSGSNLDKDVSESIVDKPVSSDNDNQNDEVKPDEFKESLNGFNESVQLTGPGAESDLEPEIDISMNSGESTAVVNEETVDESWESLNVKREEEEPASVYIDAEFKEDRVEEAEEDSKKGQGSFDSDNIDNDESSKWKNVCGLQQSESNEEDLGIEVAYRKHLDNSVKEQAESTVVEDIDSDSSDMNNEEPVVDLFELGAVEIESAEAR